MKKIRVLLADDHAVVRDGLSALLSEYEDIEIIAQAADGLETVRLAADLQPDVVVMDIAMPHLNGVEATRRVLKSSPETRVLVLSQYDQDEYVLDAVSAGASGYLLKRDAGAELAHSLRAMCRWGAVLHPSAARVLLDAYQQCQTALASGDRLASLTDREREVLTLVAEGFTNQQMAEILCVSPKTIDGHRTSLMGKLNLHDRTEVVKYALRRNLIEL